MAPMALPLNFDRTQHRLVDRLLVLSATAGGLPRAGRWQGRSGWTQPDNANGFLGAFPTNQDPVVGGG